MKNAQSGPAGLPPLPEIRQLIELKNWRALKDSLSACPPSDIADLLEGLEAKEAVLLFRLLPRQLAADVFSEIAIEAQRHLLHQMSDEHILGILLELSPDERTELFEELPGKVTQRLLNLLPPEERQEALRLLGYPENSVGRLMTPDYVAIRPSWTVAQALSHIRRWGRDAETINRVYVIDEHWHLIDDIGLRRLILAEPQERVETLMDRSFVAIPALEDQETAVKLMKRYDLIVLPVVDSQNVLLGVVTVDDILDVLEDEVTEDIQKGASVMPFEVNYTTAPVWTLFRKRIIWLLLLVLAGFLSGSVIAAFEEALGALIVLAFFIPVLIDTGGNTATQSATLIIRAIAIGDLTPRRWFSVVKKELLIGLLLGVALSVILSLWAYFWRGTPTVSLVVGLAVIIIALWANLLGSLLPIALTKLRLDPAIISSPLITTIMDVTGLLIYFSIAIWLLRLGRP